MEEWEKSVWAGAAFYTADHDMHRRAVTETASVTAA